MRQMRLAEASTCASLQCLWRVRYEDGPPLSVPCRVRAGDGGDSRGCGDGQLRIIQI